MATVTLKLTKRQRWWLTRMGQDMDYCIGPGPQTRAILLQAGLIQEKDGLVKITPLGLRTLVSPQH